MSIVCSDDSAVGRRLSRAGLDQAISIYTSVEDAAVAATEQPRAAWPPELLSL